MNKYIHFILFILLFSCLKISAQNSNALQSSNTVPVANGYYQTINLDEETSCDCNEKTQRTRDLSKGLRPKDVINYDLHAYKITLKNSFLSVPKLFKGLENDTTVYKVSMKEWDSFMLLTTKDFDALSFEVAAMKVFAEFSVMLPEDFLRMKNTDSYNEYVEELMKNKK